MLVTVGTAAAVLLLDRVTTAFSGAAAHSKDTDPVTVFPPKTGFGVSEMVRTRIGRTDNVIALATCTPHKLTTSASRVM
jgi:hypothetical protein